MKKIEAGSIFLGHIFMRKSVFEVCLFDSECEIAETPKIDVFTS